jgi:TfoX/Sxy family transcriptional regulator of competence genes
MSIAMARDHALELADRLEAMGPLTVTRFFGGAGLVKGGVQFAFVMNGALYVRVDDVTRPGFEAMGAVPFRPGKCSLGAKPASYYALPEQIFDDHAALLAWMGKAWHAAAAAKRKTRRPRATDGLDMLPIPG